MNATPQTSWPWPSKARRSGFGPDRRAAVEGRPLGAAAPLVVRRAPERLPAPPLVDRLRPDVGRLEAWIAAYRARSWRMLPGLW